VENERAEIAREIHDDVGGSLTALKFDLAWLARRTHDSELRGRVQSALETVTYAIEASQRIMHNLRPAILEQGLVAALQWMTARFERRTGVVTVFRTSHEVLVPLAPGVALTAYRIAQEALTNVVKHAHARHAQLVLASGAGGGIQLTITDDGAGMPTPPLTPTDGFGLIGMQERVRALGGTLQLHAGARGGTVVTVTVPLP